MNLITIVCLSFLMAFCKDFNGLILYEGNKDEISNYSIEKNKDEISNYNTEVNVPIHSIVAKNSYFTIEDYKERYREIRDAGLDYYIYTPLAGPIYIRSDNTLWSYVINSYEEKGEIKYEKIGDNIASVETNDDKILKLKIDGSLWIKGYENIDENIADEYGFSKIADDVVMTLPVYEPKYECIEVYALKKDNTLWKILYIDKPIKVLDDTVYVSINYSFTIEYVVLIKTDGSLWQCKGTDFDKLEKVTDDAIYTGGCWNYGIVVKRDKGLYLWNCEDPNKQLIKIDNNVEYAMVSNQITALKTDGSLWYYHFDHKTLDKNTVLKAKLADNVQALLTSHLFKDKDNKLVRIGGKLQSDSPDQTPLEVLEGYDIKTPELYDITKPFE